MLIVWLLSDIMTQLASAGQVPLKDPAPPVDPRRKRDREDRDDDQGTPSDHSSTNRHPCSASSGPPSANPGQYEPVHAHEESSYNASPFQNYQLQSALPAGQQYPPPGVFSPRIGYDDSSGSSASSWESYPIGGGFVPGMNTTLSRTPGLLAGGDGGMMQDFMGSMDPTSIGVASAAFVDPLTRYDCAPSSFFSEA